jgi:hypothetical protein
MGKTMDFINEEKDKYGRLLYSINSAIGEIAPFIDKKDLYDRKYVSRVTVLNRYMELLKELEEKEKKDGFLGFLNDEEHVSRLKEFKKQNHDDLEQLERCSNCKHITCPPSCKASHCLSCRKGSWVAHCDHNRMNVTFHDRFTLDLVNDRTGIREKYKVLATLYNAQMDKQYIIIEGTSSLEKFVLYYYPGIIEDIYGEITDEQEFDFVVSTFESVER